LPVPFAGDQDVGVGRSDARDHVEHRTHRGRPGDELREALSAQGAVLRLQPHSLAKRASQLDLRLQNRRKPRVVPGFLDKIARSTAHCLHRQLDRPPGGHHDHRQRGVERLDPIQEFEALLAGGGVAGVIEVHQHRVEVAGFDGVDGGGRGIDSFGGVSFALHQEAERFQDVGLVISDEDRRPGVGGFHWGVS